MTTHHIETSALRSSDQEAFGRRGYLLLPALVEPALADFLWSYVHTKFACRLLSLSSDKGQAPGHPFNAYGPLFSVLSIGLGQPSREQAFVRVLLPRFRHLASQGFRAAPRTRCSLVALGRSVAPQPVSLGANCVLRILRRSGVARVRRGGP
jgi:hypothetical protein